MSNKRKKHLTVDEVFEAMYSIPSGSECSSSDSEDDWSDLVDLNTSSTESSGTNVTNENCSLSANRVEQNDASCSENVVDSRRISNDSNRNGDASDTLLRPSNVWSEEINSLLDSIQESDNDTSSEYLPSSNCSSDDENSDGEMSDESDCLETNWHKARPLRTTPIPTFEKEISPTYPFSVRDHPSIFFSKVFPDNILQNIVTQTNLYALQSKSNFWQDITAEEIKAFIGLHILMGLHPLPIIDLYWSSDPLYHNPQISNVMTLKRFKKITENLHLNDNSKTPERGSPQFDKLYKIRPLHDGLRKSFSEAAVPSDRMSIDESMVKFKGRSSLKQYMPKKPTKRGYKIWARADARTGYLYEFEQYHGKSDDGSVLEGLGYKVVMSLSTNLPPKTLVVFDNFFTSVQLMEDLHKRQIFSIGTVQTNRKDLPLMMKHKNKLEKGEHKWRYKEDLLAVQWQDNKVVNVLSTAHEGTEVQVVNRKLKDGTVQPIPCPTAIADYTRNMGGVDRFDRLKVSYPIGRKSKKWWMRMFFFLLDSAVTNAYILYQLLHSTKNQTHMNFRIRLARALIGELPSSRKRKGPAPLFLKKNEAMSVPDEIRLSKVGIHMPVGEGKYRRCRFCSTRKTEKRTKIICEACKVPLCATPCFKKFHL